MSMLNNFLKSLGSLLAGIVAAIFIILVVIFGITLIFFFVICSWIFLIPITWIDMIFSRHYFEKVSNSAVTTCLDGAEFLSELPKKSREKLQEINEKLDETEEEIKHLKETE